MSTPNTTGTKSRAENLLFRSRVEICRIMQLLAHRHSPVTAEIKNGHPFASHILAIDKVRDHFFIAFGPHKLINAMVLDSASVEFTATDNQGLHFSFEATHPEDAQLAGSPAIRFVLPKTLLLHNRREHARIPVSPDISLRCIADADGFIPFESHITDVSHDGLGCLLYDPDINLESGTILKGCRIITPHGDAIVADLELLHIAPGMNADGTLTLHAGFHFVHKTDEQAKLISLFIQDLDKK